MGSTLLEVKAYEEWSCQSRKANINKNIYWVHVLARFVNSTTTELVLGSLEEMRVLQDYSVSYLTVHSQPKALRKSKLNKKNV